jgi:F0F1-type ATP synthase gamma subunit
MLNYRKENNMKDNFEELDQRFLEITRDLTNSLGHKLLTDELIVVKEHFFNLIHQYYRISDFLIEKTRRELEEVIESNPKLKKMIEDSLQGTKWID